ncbi:hypothetical protein Y032_0541g3187 [Ancylostoma ceylanicum]|uniref:CCHC-type domain-containing protein n=1 Tax=Ancylostoma ceylanicum TaxID=53326 RepID=A0A016WR64_9BILA|nr:hypothetical protein Y032_0541g3187 [Ancylostoma ceylanicum]
MDTVRSTGRIRVREVQYEIVLLKECEMGSAPSDRQCRICHRVGHFAESCPKVGDEETRATNVAKDELVEGDFRNQHGLRTFRREPWPRKAPPTYVRMSLPGCYLPLARSVRIHGASLATPIFRGDPNATPP